MFEREIKMGPPPAGPPAKPLIAFFRNDPSCVAVDGGRGWRMSSVQ